MAVQAQLYSDHYQNYNNMGISSLPQDLVFVSGFESGHDQRYYQQDQRFLENQKIMNYDSGFVSSSAVSSSNSRRIGLQNLSSELERQRLEMACFLHFQNERLKKLLNEETRRIELILMQTYESKMKAIMEAKKEVLTTAANRTLELQNYLQMAEKQSKSWQTKAIENEAIVNDLNKKLNIARAKKHEEDAESVCYDHDHDDGMHERMVCKMCHVRSSCILSLPCGHLSCCRACEGLVMFCPICENVKNGSLEVYFGLN